MVTDSNRTPDRRGGPKKGYMSFRKKVDHLNVWSSGGKRAPHKPLLLLLVLGRKSQDLPDEVSFAEIEEKLKDLLVEFGPLRQANHPEYPFWRLQKDGIWKVTSDVPLIPRPVNGDVTVMELRQKNARGRLPQSALDELNANPRLLIEAAQSILDSHFPYSLHEDIAAAVGLALTADVRHRRDPRFRGKVLMAYEYSCAICGLDVRLRNATIGLEAAHIKWHQAHGPDVEANGLALCATHHKLFDFGALSLTDSGIIILSKQLNGSGDFADRVLKHHGTTVRPPQDPAHTPGNKYVSWHQKWVFKGPARAL